MFWIIFIFVMIGIAILGAKISSMCFSFSDEIGATMIGTGIILAIISLCASIILIIDGLSDYPALLGKYQRIETISKSKKEIKDSYYKEVKSGSLIAGDIANTSQSSNVSKYIVDLANLSGEYNESLLKCQLYESDLFYNMFGKGLFINHKIQELKLIK